LPTSLTDLHLHLAATRCARRRSRPIYYYDPEIFAAEKEQIWCKTWQYVGYLGDLTEPGDYITANILDQLIFVIRAASGELRAFYNVCMHRGHILVEGKGNKRIITCPSHAWSYDSHGNLKAAGNAQTLLVFASRTFACRRFKSKRSDPWSSSI
jgi:phenylpropionate dioxygenase-like ring-hydroxylating dioxygenase large terminal subunit